MEKTGKKMKLAVLAILAAVLALTFAACGGEGKTPDTSAPPSPSGVVTPGTDVKYVFMFIGDGMSAVQTNAAALYLNRDSNTAGSVAQSVKLSYTAFPYVGSATTYDSSSFCPDSASTATSLSSGIKTLSGTIGMGNTGLVPDKAKKSESIAEKFKKAGKKVGLVSTVTLNHATPAGYYAHVESRGYNYELNTQLANSGFDYFAGGSLTGDTDTITAAETEKGYTLRDSKNNIWETLADKGYKVVTTKAGFDALTPADGKVYTRAPELQDSGAMKYAMDNGETDVSLTDFVKKGITMLNGDAGFFLMVESGKVDWACHANDAKASILDTVEFAKSIEEAVKFQNRHPDETLILVTGDHETGGLTIGQATTNYDTAFKILESQKVSYIEFDKIINAGKAGYNSLSDVMPLITENYGLTTAENGGALKLTAYQLSRLEAAFAHFKNGRGDTDTEEFQLLYGGYNPLSITITHILNNKAGIGWTSYAHTGVPVPVYAKGAGEVNFGGAYDNTDVFKKLAALTKMA